MVLYQFVIMSNDPQGKKDQEDKVRKCLGTRPENEVLFVIPEDDIEQHLCASGFTQIYEKFLNKQSQANVKAAKTDPEYFKQLTKAVADYKIAAVHAVLAEIRDGQIGVPPLFTSAIDAAIQWANQP